MTKSAPLTNIDLTLMRHQWVGNKPLRLSSVLEVGYVHESQ